MELCQFSFGAWNYEFWICLLLLSLRLQKTSLSGSGTQVQFIMFSPSHSIVITTNNAKKPACQIWKTINSSEKSERMYHIWWPPSLSKSTPMLIYMELTHLCSEAIICIIYKEIQQKINKIQNTNIKTLLIKIIKKEGKINLFYLFTK